MLARCIRAEFTEERVNAEAFLKQLAIQLPAYLKSLGMNDDISGQPLHLRDKNKP